MLQRGSFLHSRQASCSPNSDADTRWARLTHTHDRTSDGDRGASSVEHLSYCRIDWRGGPGENWDLVATDSVATRSN